MPSATPKLPTHQTALVASGPGKLALRHDVPVPVMGADQAIIRTGAVAINPADAKMLDFNTDAIGAIHGYDFAGTTVALGVDAPSHLAVGDRVAGIVHGNNSLVPGTGAFSEYVAAYADLLLKLPDSMSFEEGSTIGTGLGTALLGLFRESQHLNVPASPAIPKPSDEESSRETDFVLAAGGATATGTRAINLLKLAGPRPIATCSPSHFGLALEFGAEKVFDYHSPTCAADIRAYTKNALTYALDCVSQADTTQLCYNAIGRAGGCYASLEPYREAITAVRPAVTPSFVMGLSLFGHKVALDGVYGRDAQPANRPWATHMFQVVQHLLDRGLFKTHPIKAMEGGWSGVVKGVETIRTQTMSGYKLVYAV